MLFRSKTLLVFVAETVEHAGRHLEHLTSQLRNAKAAGRNHVATFEVNVFGGTGKGLRAWCRNASRWHQALSGYAWNREGGILRILLRGIRDDVEAFVTELSQRFAVASDEIDVQKSNDGKVPKEVFGIHVRPDNWETTSSYSDSVRRLSTARGMLN